MVAFTGQSKETPDEITKLAVADERVVLLSGDIGNRLFDDFKDHVHPRQPTWKG